MACHYSCYIHYLNRVSFSSLDFSDHRLLSYFKDLDIYFAVSPCIRLSFHLSCTYLHCYDIDLLTLTFSSARSPQTRPNHICQFSLLLFPNFILNMSAFYSFSLPSATCRKALLSLSWPGETHINTLFREFYNCK